MRLLLNSYVLLWTLISPIMLRRGVIETLVDPRTDVYYSAASLWELAIKRATGRIRVDDETMLAEIACKDFVELPITPRHGLAAAAPPRLHADPFDRILIAQTSLEGLVLATRDSTIARYDIPTMEA